MFALLQLPPLLRPPPLLPLLQAPPLLWPPLPPLLLCPPPLLQSCAELPGGFSGRSRESCVPLQERLSTVAGPLRCSAPSLVSVLVEGNLQALQRPVGPCALGPAGILTGSPFGCYCFKPSGLRACQWMRWVTSASELRALCAVWGFLTPSPASASSSRLCGSSAFQARAHPDRPVHTLRLAVPASHPAFYLNPHLTFCVLHSAFPPTKAGKAVCSVGFCVFSPQRTVTGVEQALKAVYAVQLRISRAQLPRAAHGAMGDGQQVGITSLQGGVALRGWRGRTGLGCTCFKFILSSV